jgi:Domain of unknown function (DUF4397)
VNRESKAIAGHEASGRFFVVSVLARSFPMRIRSLLPIAGLCAAVGLLYACSLTTRENAARQADSAHVGDIHVNAPLVRPHDAMVRFVNAMPGSAALELGHDSLMLFGNVVFGAVTPYKAVPATPFRFTVRHAATVGFDASSAASVEADQRYSVFALPDSNGRMTVRVLRDDLTPVAGKARVRLVHATPEITNLTFAVVGQDEPLFTAESDSGFVHFRDLSPMTAGFRVRGGAGNAMLVSLKSMALAAGTTYTVVLTSRPGVAITAITFSDSGTESPRLAAPVSNR